MGCVGHCWVLSIIVNTGNNATVPAGHDGGVVMIGEQPETLG